MRRPIDRSYAERLAVFALCGLAAVRVFVFSAAFPFFNNVDEQAHFDLVMKYASGDVPEKVEPLSRSTLDLWIFYASPEFNRKPQRYPDGRIPRPPWTLPQAELHDYRARAAALPLPVNYESSDPPVYYALAGAWARLGGALGISGAALVYWIRFLNVAVIAAVVWVGYLAARLSAPDAPFVRLGVPVLLAAWPQDAFFSVQSDVFSPLACGLAFIALLHWMRLETSRPGRSLATGLVLALACLVKTSNAGIVAAAALVACVPVVRLGRFRSLAWVVAGAAGPLAAWGAWCVRHFGDATGSRPKIQAWGWSPKPLVDWLPHPIFTFRGFGHFWTELLARFWRGEFVWGFEPLSVPAMDVFYWSSASILLCVAAFSLFSKRNPVAVPFRQALGVALAAFLAGVGSLFVLSIALDFGNCPYPSRELPYFTAGRLMSGAIVPFFVLYVHGLHWGVERVNAQRHAWWILAAIALAMIGTQVGVDRVALASEYNWFHLP